MRISARAVLLALVLVPTSVLARATAGPALAGEYAMDREGNAEDLVLGIGLEGHATGAPSIGTGISFAWGFDTKSAFLDLHWGLGYSIVTLDALVLGALGSPGAGLALGPQLAIAIPFPFVGDASLAQVFGRYEHFVLGEEDFGHRITAGLRFVIDATRRPRE